MKTIKWILSIPASVVVYLISSIAIAFLWNLIPSLEENPILNNYIMPSVINIICIFLYFMTGQAIISPKSHRDTKKANFLLSIVMLAVQLDFLYLSFASAETSKIISSIVGCILAIFALIESVSNKNK